MCYYNNNSNNHCFLLYLYLNSTNIALQISFQARARETIEWMTNRYCGQKRNIFVIYIDGNYLYLDIVKKMKKRTHWANEKEKYRKPHCLFYRTFVVPRNRASSSSSALPNVIHKMCNCHHKFCYRFHSSELVRFCAWLRWKTSVIFHNNIESLSNNIIMIMKYDNNDKW